MLISYRFSSQRLFFFRDTIQNTKFGISWVIFSIFIRVTLPIALVLFYWLSILYQYQLYQYFWLYFWFIMILLLGTYYSIWKIYLPFTSIRKFFNLLPLSFYLMYIFLALLKLSFKVINHIWQFILYLFEIYLLW